MNIETFSKAAELRKQINHFEVKTTQIRLMEERDNDNDFNMLRQLAFDGCEFAIKTLEKEFDKL